MDWNLRRIVRIHGVRSDLIFLEIRISVVVRIAAGAVVVPTYGNDMAARLACEALATVFPDREIIPLPSTAILSGGGSFHCISQLQPVGRTA